MKYRPKASIGEFCGPCYREDGSKVEAPFKVEEVIFDDDPVIRHPYTQYICEGHFKEIMGPWAERRY
jgi:hypothetical protein